MNTTPQRKWQHAVALEPVQSTQDRCPVCDIELDVQASPSLVLPLTLRRQHWARCPACHSFFALDAYDVERFTGEIRTKQYGQTDSGVAWGEAKEPLYRAILRALRDLAPRGSHLLDVGCSFGNFLESARAEGYQVRGVDIVPEAAEYVRSHGIPCDHAASVADVDIPDNSQDIVSVLDCNYYWPDQRHELRAIRARLRPGGLLVMRVADTSWAIRLALEIARVFPTAGRKLFERAVYDHRVSIPIHSLLKVMRDEGFSTVYTSVRDAVPVSHHNLKALAAYAIGAVSWAVAGINLAPGMVLIARKELS